MPLCGAWRVAAPYCVVALPTYRPCTSSSLLYRLYWHRDLVSMLCARMPLLPSLPSLYWRGKHNRLAVCSDGGARRWPWPSCAGRNDVALLGGAIVAICSGGAAGVALPTSCFCFFTCLSRGGVTLSCACPLTSIASMPLGNVCSLVSWHVCVLYVCVCIIIFNNNNVYVIIIFCM